MSLFFIPRHPETGTMWDTWLFAHVGTWYLYYLGRLPGAGANDWDHIGLATSRDGVGWTEVGPILRMSKEATWMGTGAVWANPAPSNGPRFQMNYSEFRGRQTILFAESDDLVHWRKRDDVRFAPDARWYEPEGRWDTIWPEPRPEGGLYGCWTATPKHGVGGRFALGRSTDGLHWEALPPPQVMGVGEGELGAVAELDGRYYAMFGTATFTTTTLVAPRREGPYEPAAKNRVLLAGQTYFPRFFPTADAMLVNHHSIGAGWNVHFGLLKQARVDGEGTLRLGWWEGNERHKQGRAMREPALEPGHPASAVRRLAPLDLSAGAILEGEMVLPASAFEPRRGLYIEYESGRGFMALFDAQGRLEAGLADEWGGACRVQGRADRELSFGRPARWRLVLDGTLLELYLDDYLMDCYALPAPATGRIGLVDGGVPNAVRAERGWS